MIPQCPECGAMMLSENWTQCGICSHVREREAKSPPAAAASSAIYTISPGYRKATVWLPCDETRERLSICTITPHADASRYERYEGIARGLEACRLSAPPYKPTKREQNDQAQSPP